MSSPPERPGPTERADPTAPVDPSAPEPILVTTILEQENR